jgi:hypothetical protein
MSETQQYAWARPGSPAFEDIATAIGAGREPLCRGVEVHDFRGQPWFFGGVSRPAYGNSSGRVSVYRTCPDAYTASNGAQECPHMWHRNGIDQQEFFPHVFGLYLGDAQGNEV